MTTAPRPPQPRLRVPGVLPALGATAAVGVVGMGLGAALGGPPQAYAAALGAVLVAGFFLMGSYGAGVAAAYAPRLSLFVALLTYTLQVVLLGMLLVGLARSERAADALDLRWLGGTILAGTLGWSSALVIDMAREAHRAGASAPGASPPAGSEVRR